MDIQIGMGVTENNWSDRTPFEVVGIVSEKTIIIREMKATLDPSWKPEFIPGGFSAHCVNQNEQKWILESNPEAPQIRIRKVQPNRQHRGGGVYGDWGLGCRRFVVGEARRHYDYNF